ncbi:integral membrane Yip1 family protein, partial [Striga asiatica]
AGQNPSWRPIKRRDPKWADPPTHPGRGSRPSNEPSNAGRTTQRIHHPDGPEAPAGGRQTGSGICLRSMANVPPVVFPTGRNAAAPSPGGSQQRRFPTAPFQPPRASSPGLPFLSFDVNSAAASTSFSAAPQFPSTIGGGGSTGFEDEPPLLEELGINTKQIYQKTLSIINPFRINYHLHEDADLSGPFLFLMAFGLFQLLAGKLHFGIILGWVTMASMFLYVVFNMLAGRNGNLDMYKCLSLIGYCMLPIVMLSAISLFLPQGGMVIMVITGLFVIWSTRVCTGLVVELANCGEEHRGLITYACFLIYMLFSLLLRMQVYKTGTKASETQHWCWLLVSCLFLSANFQ